MAVEHSKPVRSNLESRRLRQDHRELFVIVVSMDGNQRRNVGEILEYGSRVSVTQVDHQVDAGTLEEIDNLIRDLTAASGIDMRVGDHADPERRLEHPLPGYRSDGVLASTHRSPKR
jgi:hypothetical protein